MKDGIQVNIVALNKQQKIFKAFAHAWKGIEHFFQHDRNGRIHLGAALASIFAGFIFACISFLFQPKFPTHQPALKSI